MDSKVVYYGEMQLKTPTCVKYFNAIWETKTRLAFSPPMLIINLRQLQKSDAYRDYLLRMVPLFAASALPNAGHGQGESEGSE